MQVIDWLLKILLSSLMGVRMMGMVGYAPGCGLRFLFLFVHLPPVPAGPATTSPSTEAPCGSAHHELKRDLLQQHHNLVNLLAALNVDACKEYRLHNASAVLSRVKEGNKTCTICRKVCSSTQILKTHIRGQHLKDPTL